MQIGDGALRMCRRLENRPAVAVEELQPRGHVACVIRPRLQLGHDAEICAKETGANVGTQFFSGALGAILVIAAEIPVQPVACAGPMRYLMAEDRVKTLRIPKRLESRHLDGIGRWLIKSLASPCRITAPVLVKKRSACSMRLKGSATGSGGS